MRVGGIRVLVVSFLAVTLTPPSPVSREREIQVSSMAEFTYKATTLAGQTVEGSMDGKDEAAVVQSLHQLGYIPIRISPAREKRRRVPNF